MPRRSNLFHRVITLINASLAGYARVVESAMLRDKITGVEREVDLLITTNAAGYKVSIAIEVVSRARKSDTTWVESMHSKHASLPTDKLILVSEKGFHCPSIREG